MHEGTTLLKQQKYLESIECFRKGFFIDPTAHFMFYLLTACQGVLKEIRPEILRYVGNALSRNPKDMNALFLKGLCYIEPGKYHIALTCFDSILMTSPNDQMISVLNHEVYKMHNRDTKPPEAEDTVQKASVKRRMAVSTLLN
jgi:tetratricopeptide (TPR) repeat protein